VIFDPAIPILKIHLQEIKEILCNNYHKIEIHKMPKEGNYLKFSAGGHW
jgi:hypothetical protein